MTQYKLVACTPYDGQSEAGFYMPIFTTMNATGTFIQVPSERGLKIEAFRPFECADEGILAVGAGAVFRAGENLAFVFVSSDKKVLFGTASEISELLKDYSVRDSIALQVAELTGDSSEKFAARLNVLRQLDRSSPSSRSLYASVVAQAVWENLVSCCVSQSALHELTAFRRSVILTADPASAEILPEGLWESISPLIDICRKQFKIRLMKELPILQSESSNYKQYQAEMGVSYEHQDHLDIAFSQIKNAGRQEERLAIIIKWLILNAEVGDYLLRSYRDRSNFANNALNLIIAEWNYLITCNNIEFGLSKFVSKFYGNCFPYSRGLYLFYFAKHLSGFKHLKSAIISQLNRTKSIYVNDYRKDIVHELENSRDPFS